MNAILNLMMRDMRIAVRVGGGASLPAALG